MKRLIALVALACSTPAGAEEPEWVDVATTRTNAVFSVRWADISAGRSHQTAARLWVKTDYSREVTVTYREVRSLFIINCPAQTFRVVQSTVYYPDGRVDTDSRATAVSVAVPGSNIATVIDVLCADPITDYR